MSDVSVRKYELYLFYLIQKHCLYVVSKIMNISNIKARYRNLQIIDLLYKNPHHKQGFLYTTVDSVGYNSLNSPVAVNSM